MVQKNTDKTEKTDIIKDYYENCKKAASCALGIASVSVIAGLETVIALTAISFSGDVSLLQICLFIFLTLILLCIAGTAVFLIFNPACVIVKDHNHKHGQNTDKIKRKNSSAFHGQSSFWQ